MITKVYRSGVVQAPAQRGCEAQSYLIADTFKPAGRIGRTEAIFASPSLSGVVRWVRGNALSNVPDYRVREIKVNAEEVYVYSVRLWERTSSYLSSDQTMKAYWDSGVLLSDWFDLNLPADEWEVLLNDSTILGVNPVSAKRLSLAASDDYTSEEVIRLLKKSA